MPEFCHKDWNLTSRLFFAKSDNPNKALAPLQKRRGPPSAYNARITSIAFPPYRYWQFVTVCLTQERLHVRTLKVNISIAASLKKQAGHSWALGLITQHAAAPKTARCCSLQTFAIQMHNKIYDLVVFAAFLCAIPSWGQGVMSRAHKRISTSSTNKCSQC